MKSQLVVAAMLYSVVVLAQPKAYTVGPIPDFKVNAHTGPMATWLDTTLKPILDSLHLSYHFGRPPGGASFVMHNTKGQLVADTMFAKLNKNVGAALFIIADTIKLSISTSGSVERDSNYPGCIIYSNFTDVDITMLPPYATINATLTVPQWPVKSSYCYTNNKKAPKNWGETVIPIATQTLQFDTFPPHSRAEEHPRERFSIRGKYTFTTAPFYRFEKGNKRKQVVVSGTYYFTTTRFINNPALHVDE